MNHVNYIQRSVLILAIFLLSMSVAFAQTKGCWAKFFESPQFKGQHFQLEGPVKMKALNNIQGSNWDRRIESILIGPKARVTVFENKNFKLTLKEMAKHPVLMKSLGISTQDILEDSEIILHPGSKIHSFGEFNFYHKIRSFKIDCVR